MGANWVPRGDQTLVRVFFAELSLGSGSVMEDVMRTGVRRSGADVDGLEIIGSGGFCLVRYATVGLLHLVRHFHLYSTRSSPPFLPFYMMAR